MRIVVLIRQVVDCRVPLPTDAFGTQPLSEGMRRVINPADWVALEQSLALDTKGRDKEITAISLGGAETEEALRWCLAAGARQALRIWDDEMSEADLHGKARVLAAALTPDPPDLILAGDSCLDQFETLLPGVLAAAAGMAYVPGVVRLEKAEEGKAVIIRQLSKGKRARVVVSLPALIAVEHRGSGGSDPADAALPALLEALGRPIPCLNLLSLGLAQVKVGSRAAKVHHLFTRPAMPALIKPRTPDPGLPAEQRLRYILAGGVSRKQGEVMAGTPEQLAEGIVRFLQNEPVLPS